MLIYEGILVGAVVLLINTLEIWLASPMLNRPMVVGALIGLLLGDLETGVAMGASLELIFMGVVMIGASTPPDALIGSAVGTAFAILTNADTEIAMTIAFPIALLASMVHTLLVTARSLWHPLIERFLDEGNDKGLERMVPVVAWTMILPKSLLVAIAVMVGTNAVQQLIDIIPEFITGGLSVASGIMAAVGFAMLLKMMWSKKMCIYYFLGFLLAAYLQLPILAIAFFGIILCVILYFEGGEMKADTTGETVSEEELFND